MKYELCSDSEGTTLHTDFAKVYFEENVVSTTPTTGPTTPSTNRILAGAPASNPPTNTLNGKEGKLVMALAGQNYKSLPVYLKATTPGGKVAIQTYEFGVKDCLI